MLYMPDATLDDHYINSYGFDIRKLNDEIPESCRSFDITDFHKLPAHKKAGPMQCLMYKSRYLRYVDALGHMLSTGQGVVLDRCCYSDVAFADAMLSSNFMTKAGMLEIVTTFSFWLNIYYLFQPTKCITTTQPTLCLSS